MPRLGIETLQRLRQEVGRRAASIGRGEASVPVDPAILHTKTVNFYNHTYALLETAGAYKGGHFQNWEERAYFAERVAAHFLEGIFPQGNNRPINGRRNKIDATLLAYTRKYLPARVEFSPQDTPEQVASERLLDRTARDVYLTFYSDALRKGNTNQLAQDFIEALVNDKPTSTYITSYHVRSEIQDALDSFEQEYRSQNQEAV